MRTVEPTLLQSKNHDAGNLVAERPDMAPSSFENVLSTNIGQRGPICPCY